MNPGRFAWAMKRPVRGLQLASKERENFSPIGSKKLTPHQIESNMRPLIGMILSGEVPLDDQGAQAVAAGLEAQMRHLRSLGVKDE